MSSLQGNTKKLTEYEWDALVKTYNLADGHPRQSLLPEQYKALQQLLPMFIRAHEGHEVEAKQQFEQAFFALAGQLSVHKLAPPLSQYSGSAAIEVLVNYLRLHKKRVAYLHPSFDSLADTMKRHGVPLTPLSEEVLYTLDSTTPKLPVDVLYLVTPNNPTGRGLTKRQFENVVAYCKEHNLLLVLDFCFRFYGDYWDYDQYEILQHAGIDFITTEDTGKSWPAADVKLGMVLSSRSLYADLKSISDDFLLSVSPFVFTVLTTYILLEDRAKYRIKSQDVVDVNRRLLRRILKGSPLQVSTLKTGMSVEWITLPRGWQAVHFSDELAKHGIQILPGERFYWNDNKKGQSYLRVALLRERHYFEQAITRLREVAVAYRP